MSTYAHEAAAVRAAAMPEDLPGRCCVPGCVLPGTIADSTTGSADWKCALHHGASYSDQAGISARMANRRRLLILAQRLMNAGTAEPVPPQVRDWIRKEQREDLIREGKGGRLTCRILGAHMLRVLTDECREPQQRVPESPQPTGKRDSWNAAGAAAQAFLGGLT